MSKPDVAIAIVCFRPTELLPQVLRAVEQSVGSDVVDTYVVASGGPRFAQRTGEMIQDYEFELLVPPAPLRIGEARIFAGESIVREHIAFLDDDCTPTETWFAELKRTLKTHPQAAMVFGPRIPNGYGSGGLIREQEAQASTKYAWLRTGVDEVLGPKALVAGGNMLVRRESLAKFRPHVTCYTNRAFEDVDLQLAAYSRGETVVFTSGMTVVHHDKLSARELITKSFRGGRGMAQCKAHHGKIYSATTRWSPWRSRWVYVGTVPILVGLLLSLVPSPVLAIASAVALVGACALARSVRTRLIKVIRDFNILAGYLYELALIRSGRTRCARRRIESQARDG